LIVTALAISVTDCGRDVARKVTEFQESFHVSGLAFDPDNGLLAVSCVGSNQVHIWSLSDTPKMMRSLKQDPDTPAEAWALSYSKVDGLRFTKDGKRLVNAHNGGEGNHFRIIRIWSATSWTPVADVTEEKAGGGPFPAQIAVSRDGKFIIRARSWGTMPDFGGPRNQYGLAFMQLEAFNSDTGQLAWTVDLPVAPEELALSPDGRRAAIVGFAAYPGAPQGQRSLVAKLCLVDLEARSVESCFNVLEHSAYLYLAAWSPDGRYIAITGSPGEDGKGRSLPGPGFEIFDAASGRITGSFTSDDQVAALQYSQDGRYLLVAGWQHVEIWDSQHTTLLQTITPFGIPGITPQRGGEPSVTAAKLSADGHRLAIAFQANVRVYDLK
jgi:WD40 repeat protein